MAAAGALDSPNLRATVFSIGLGMVLPTATPRSASVVADDRFWPRFARDVARGVCLLVLLHIFVLQISVVRGHSMRPSLLDGDRLVVDRVGHQLAGISRFDMIVLRYPVDPGVDFVKRVVGLPGDRVRLERGGLFVNGTPIPQEFGHVEESASMPERIVPPDHYFVLGDNRPISCDSREFGVVAGELVKGTVRARFWPLDRLGLF